MRTAKKYTYFSLNFPSIFEVGYGWTSYRESFKEELIAAASREESSD
jgi:hypothetical protein